MRTAETGRKKLLQQNKYKRVHKEPALKLFYGIDVGYLCVFNVHGVILYFVKVARFGIDQPRGGYFAVQGVKLFGRNGYAYKLAEIAFQLPRLCFQRSVKIIGVISAGQNAFEKSEVQYICFWRAAFCGNAFNKRQFFPVVRIRALRLRGGAGLERRNRFKYVAEFRALYGVQKHNLSKV